MGLEIVLTTTCRNPAIRVSWWRVSGPCCAVIRTQPPGSPAAEAAVARFGKFTLRLQAACSRQDGAINLTTGEFASSTPCVASGETLSVSGSGIGEGRQRGGHSIGASNVQMSRLPPD